MGEPFFKIKDTVAKNKINVFSTNFALYGDISNRIMSILARFTPEIEVYSIDEAFLDFNHLSIAQSEKYAQKIVEIVRQETGVPISIGISQTKTLAKIASKFAKKHPELLGAKYLDYNDCDLHLKDLPVKEVWGVGWKLNQTLPKYNIYSALDLKKSDISFIRSKFGVGLQKTVLELNGTDCVPILGSQSKFKKNIIRSRSFGQKITEIEDIENAISTFIAQAARELRKQHEVAWMVSTYIRTDRFSTNQQYKNLHTIALPFATNDTIILNKIALQALRKVFLKGYTYKKAGIMLSNVIPESTVQYTLEENVNLHAKNKPLMQAVDKLNIKFGDHALHLASEGEHPRWISKSKLRSPNYLTSWTSLPIVK
jgi:DNA polymerase V